MILTEMNKKAIVRNLKTNKYTYRIALKYVKKQIKECQVKQNSFLIKKILLQITKQLTNV